MACLYPKLAYDTGRINSDTGKRIITFRAPKDYLSAGRVVEMAVPCGKCAGCLKDKRKDWCNRMALELFAHDGVGSFVTLTYRDPAPPCLVKSDVQKFFKRLRNVNRDFGVGLPSQLRYFACGEYGKKHHRPHYHAVVFGVDMLHDDAWQSYLCGVADGRPRYSSRILEHIWPYGFVVVGDCNYHSIRYVSKYISKQYQQICKDDVPPFTLKSIGLGRSLFVDVRRKSRQYHYRLKSLFFDRYEDGSIVLPSVSGYSPVKLPSCLDIYAERFAPSLFADVKARRLDFVHHTINDVAPSVRRDFIDYQNRTELLKGELDNE